MKKKVAYSIMGLLSVIAFSACMLYSTGREKECRFATEVPFDTIITQKVVPPYSISPYDDLFHEYGDTLGWDWKWLAAVAYQESRFNAEAMNPSGAVGLMQIMPVTATSMGVDSLHLTDPRSNVKAAIRLFQLLDNRFTDVPMPDRVCMVLASYNAGYGHIQDAMRLAEARGGMGDRWEGNVEYFLRRKREPAFYNDSVCRNGRFTGRETTAFVRNVHNTYNEYVRLEELYNSVQKADTILIPRKDHTQVQEVHQQVDTIQGKQ